jgi:sec-independent protein translocase protein TatA
VDLLLMGFLQSPVALIVLLVIALLVFGKRLPEVARSLGKGIVEFKKGVKGVEDDIDRLPPPPSQPYYNQGQYNQPQYGAQQPQPQYGAPQPPPSYGQPQQPYSPPNSGQHPGAQPAAPQTPGAAYAGYTPPAPEQGHPYGAPPAQPQGAPAPVPGEPHKPLD